MKSFTIELDDELFEQVSRLDNAPQRVANLLRDWFDLIASPNHETWLTEQEALGIAEADSAKASWTPAEQVFDEAYAKLFHAR